MILGYHLIFCAYGFWLPNDPRGSKSTVVHAAHLRPFGPATPTATRTSVAASVHDSARRLAAKAALKFPPVRFTDAQRLTIGQAVGEESTLHRIVIHAAAIMPDHVHLVIARHAMQIEDIAQRLKKSAGRALTCAHIHPMEDYRDATGRAPSPWADGQWSVYLDSPTEVLQRIAYVNRNPPMAGLLTQRWPWVTPYASV